MRIAREAIGNRIAQAGIVQDIQVEDFDKDGYPDLLLVGNLYEISTQLGRLDSFHGVILQNDKNGGFSWKRDANFDVSGPARAIEKIRIQDEDFFVITINNQSPVFLMLN